MHESKDYTAVLCTTFAGVISEHNKIRFSERQYSLHFVSTTKHTVRLHLAETSRMRYVTLRGGNKAWLAVTTVT